MARVKAGGRDWAPGQSGNPNGRPKLPQDVKEARELTRASFTRLINKYLHSTPDVLKEVITNPTSLVIDAIVCKILLECGQKGDTMRLAFIIERLLGKVKEEVEISTPRPTIIERSDGKEIVLATISRDEDS